MSFFLRHPHVWIAVWVIVALGGLVMIVNGLSDAVQVGQLLRGGIGMGVGLMMIHLIRKNMKSRLLR